MDSNYRIITREVFDRIPMEGIAGTRDTRHRRSRDRSLVMVKRPFGIDANARWMSHSDAIAILETPEWTISEADFWDGNF